MKKITILSIAAAAMLFYGCNDTKKAASEAADKTVETTKAAADTVKEAAKDSAGDVTSAVEKAGDAISEATEKAVEAAKKAADASKEAAGSALDSTKEAASNAVESTKKAADSVVDSAKESVAAAATKVADAVTSTTDSAKGAAIFKKCSGCHGVDGKTKALGKSAEIAGESKEDLITKISEYKTGTRDVAGMGSLMKGQVAALSDEDIEAVAQYISTLK